MSDSFSALIVGSDFSTSIPNLTFFFSMSFFITSISALIFATESVSLTSIFVRLSSNSFSLSSSASNEFSSAFSSTSTPNFIFVSSIFFLVSSIAFLYFSTASVFNGFNFPCSSCNLLRCCSSPFSELGSNTSVLSGFGVVFVVCPPPFPVCLPVFFPLVRVLFAIAVLSTIMSV